MADENIIIDVYGVAKASSFAKAGEEGSKIAQQAFRPIQVDADFSKLVNKIGASKTSFNQLTESTRDFGDSLERGLSRITALGAASGALFGIARAFEASIQAARNLEASLKSINVILNLPSDKLKEFGNDLFDVARQTKQSFESVAASAQEFSRQGLNAAQTIERTRAALLLGNLASIDAVKATETITAAINSFSKENLSAIEVVNKLVAVDAKFAVSSADLAEALTRVGSTAQEAGVGFDKLISLVTGAQQITQRGGSVIGNALNTIFTRLKREDTLNALEQLGIQVREVEAGTGRLTGALVPADRVLSQLAEKFKTLTQEQRANVAEAVAGVRQGNILAGVFASLGIAQEAYTTSINASDQALRRQAELLQTQDARIKNLGTSFQQLGANVAQTGFGDRINDLLKGLTEGNSNSISANIGGALIKAFSGTGNSVGEQVGADFAKVFIKSISDIISGPGLVAIGLIGVKISQVLSEFAGKQFKQLNLFSNTDVQLQENIDRLLNTQFEKASQILKTETDKVAAEQQILRLLGEQNARIVEGIGLRKGITELLNTPKARAIISENPVRNGAGGIVDAIAREQSAISKGVGGASPSAKPVVLPNFNGGSAVVNTDEYLVKNYANRGKDAIFNKEMVQQYGVPENAQKISGGSLAAMDSSHVLRNTSAPVGALLKSGKFTEEQLRKFLDIKNLFNGFIQNYAESKSYSDREVALGSTLRIPLQRGAYPSQIIPQRGQTKRVADQLLGLGLSREEVTEVLKNFRSGRSSAQPLETGRGKTPLLVHDEIFGKRDLLSLFLTPKDIAPNIRASGGHIPNYAATNHPLKLTRTGIIQRQLPTGELTRPSTEFLEEAYKHYHRTEIEGVLRAFEKQGRFLTEEEFLGLTRENQRINPIRPASSFAEGSVPNYALGDVLPALQNFIRELQGESQKLLENKEPFAQNQLAIVPPPRPPIPNVNFNLRARQQQLLLENNQPQSAFTPFSGITSTQTNATLSPQLFAGQEQERLKFQAINQRDFLSKQPKPFEPLEGRSFEVEGSRRKADNAKFSAGIEQVVKEMSNLDKELLDSSSVLKKMVNASNKLQEEYLAGTKTQAEFNKISARLNQSVQGEVGRLLTTPSVQPSLTLAQANGNRFSNFFSQDRLQRIGGRASTAAFAIPFAGEAAVSGLTNSFIGDDITRSRVQRGASTALSGLSTAALIASLAPNPAGLAVAGGAAAIGVGKGVIEATTESPEERAQKLDRFVKEIGLQRDAIESARRSVINFQNALDDSTVTEKQRISFQKEALAATRGVNDAGVASALRRQILGRDFSGKTNEGVEEQIKRAFQSQERQVVLNPNNLNAIFDKAAQESTTRTSNGFKKTGGAEGLSNETVNANFNVALQDILSKQKPEEQVARAKELAKNSEDAARAIKNIAPAFQNNFSLSFGKADQPLLAQSDQSFRVAAQIAEKIQKALTPEQLQANAGRITQIREVRGNVQEQIKFFADLLSSQAPKLKQEADELEKVQKQLEEFKSAIDLTAFSLQKLGEFTLRDIERSGQVERDRNQRLISQQGELDIGRNFGQGAGEIQFKGLEDAITNATLDAQKQQVDLARQAASQFQSSVLTGTAATTIKGVLPTGEQGFKDLIDKLGNTTNLKDFTSQVEDLQALLRKNGGPQQLDLANAIGKLGQQAKEAQARLDEATKTEISRNKALESQNALNARFNPNKTEIIGNVGQQIDQGRFLSGLAPTTTEDINQANKEQLSVLQQILNVSKTAGIAVNPDLENRRAELQRKVSLSDIGNAQNKLSELDFSGIKNGAGFKELLTNFLATSKETVEKTTPESVARQAQLTSIQNVGAGLGKNISAEKAEELLNKFNQLQNNTVAKKIGAGGDVTIGENPAGKLEDFIEKNLTDVESSFKIFQETGQSLSKTVSDFNDLANSLNKGELSQNISQAVKDGFKLSYGGDAIPFNGSLSINLDSGQIDTLTQTILGKVTDKLNGDISNIQTKLDIHSENLKAVNKQVGVAIPPKNP